MLKQELWDTVWLYYIVQFNLNVSCCEPPAFIVLSRFCHCSDPVPAMRSVHVWLCLALLLPWCVRSQRNIPDLANLDENTQRSTLAIDILKRAGVLDSLIQLEHQTVLRQGRVPRPASQVPKRAQQGSRFALSLDVPTSILSVLIDLAKNQDMRSKAAANAELMARIGKRK